jgi:hypothetical protein
MFTQLEADIDAQQPGIPFNDNLQNLNSQIVELSAQSGLSAFENNLIV